LKLLYGRRCALFGIGELLGERFHALDLDKFLSLLNCLPFGRKLSFMFLELLQVLSELLNEVLLPVEPLHELFAHSFLMVAKDSHLLVGLFVFLELGFHRETVEIEFFQLILKSRRSVVSSEDFGSKSVHLGLKVVVEGLSIDFIEQIIICIFSASEQFDVLPHFGKHFHSVDVPHGIFSQEV
jgi:hypothetical protein